MNIEHILETFLYLECDLFVCVMSEKAPVIFMTVLKLIQNIDMAMMFGIFFFILMGVSEGNRSGKRRVVLYFRT